jgi:hypothetical protein
VIGGDTETVREFITHGENGLLAPTLDSKALARTILGLLEDKPLTSKLRANARAYAERHLAMGDYLASYCDLIGRLAGENPAPVAEPAPSPRRKQPVRRTKPASGAEPAPQRMVAAGA